jgi:release factor glutamine methyltransferase
MAVKLQTIKDIRNYLSGELSGLYSQREAVSIADRVISKVLGINRLSYILKENEIITDRKKVKTIIRYCSELKTGKPIQYVTGETLFYDCVLKVSRGVLIPRPETEELVDLVVKDNKGFEGSIIDIGSGSGAIAIALAASLPSARVTGIDISPAAIRTATKNALNNNVPVIFFKADIFKLNPSGLTKSDIIVSNPPYVRNSEMQYMKNNVVDFEPHKALFVPDRDPLKYYRAILGLSDYILIAGGSIYFEINEAMGKQVSDLLESHKFREIMIIKDINGKDRIAKGKKHE